MLQAELKKAITQAVHTVYGDIAVPDFSVDVPEVSEFGDYASNVAMMLAKPLKKKPMEIAGALIEVLEKGSSRLIKKIDIAAPGFINIFVVDNLIIEFANDALKKPGSWGKSTEGRDKIIVIDYFALNIAKEPHVGHLRSAVIGDSLKRILYAMGYKTVADTHVGDWGTQFGILLWAWKNMVKEEDRIMYEERPFLYLGKLYQAANDQILQKPEFHEFAKAEFAKLEQGDIENRKIWQWMVDISMRKLEESATRLKLLAFEENMGESAYEDMMPPIVELALKKGIAKKTDDGAVIVDLTQENLDEAILIKSDGATTYLLRDLATIKHRQEKWHFWKNVYVVDNRQSHHFRQLFRVAELLGFEGVGASEHVDFGFMKLPEGAMSTRAGNVISLDAVLDEAERRARETIKEKNPNLKDADIVAKKVGLGAIKFFDLIHNRKSDVIFRWEDALSFEGNTGPYIQYTHARLKSILRKSTDEVGEQFLDNTEFDREERALLFTCARLPEAMERVIGSWSPHLFASYIYSLAQQVNEFYHTHPILSEKNKEKREALLMLVQVVATTLATGLYLLGIDAPEEM
ncbi:MAG: arginine--tRNA ligase [bacterium]|nr:arginine--tRNA ligase [bacterium]MDZ4285539.1 arginine--tRNA ligase [Candidatus Sungbacteria bacterium]